MDLPSLKNSIYQKTTPQSIQALFASIAPHYDKANAFASLGLHHVWNRRLLSSIGHPTHLLDLCAGTGEIGCRFLATHPKSRATLVDFCPEMLEKARSKGAAFGTRMTTLCADAMDLPFSEASFEAVTIAYGIRNVHYPEKCFEQVFRVLTPGGYFSILELTRPRLPLLHSLHRLYTYTMLPLWGRFLSRNPEAYRYLARSVQQFASPDLLSQQLLATGFRSLHLRPLLFGTATLFTCQKPK